MQFLSCLLFVAKIYIIHSIETDIVYPLEYPFPATSVPAHRRLDVADEANEINSGLSDFQHENDKSGFRSANANLKARSIGSYETNTEDDVSHFGIENDFNDGSRPNRFRTLLSRMSEEQITDVTNEAIERLNEAMASDDVRAFRQSATRIGTILSFRKRRQINAKREQDKRAVIGLKSEIFDDASAADRHLKLSNLDSNSGRIEGRWREARVLRQKRRERRAHSKREHEINVCCRQCRRQDVECLALCGHNCD